MSLIALVASLVSATAHATDDRPHYCPRCKLTKQRRHFRLKKRRTVQGEERFSLSAYCKPCWADYMKERKALWKLC